eukprot:TRINITY_DN1614_c0_g2_i1.p1 TRINITY_DN1614_c0_g2~~TRINITY_DN1614_c0_g2_i1.p1  ORF type:complete len:459 (+),score=153.94 TRINITY_DN1614_c0_g2_i1:77-1378(+)
MQGGEAKRQRTDGGRGTALLSVFDKTGVVDFARRLDALGFRLASTGGTAAAIRQGGLEVTEVGELISATPQAPDMFGGKLKTLQPAVHGALLARSDADMAELRQHGVEPISLVACSMAPAAGAPDVDIGGNCLLRTAAKNSERVYVVCDPEDYGIVTEAIASGCAQRCAALRSRLAAKALSATAEYDRKAAEAAAAAAGMQRTRLHQLPPSVYVAMIPRDVAAAAYAEAQRHPQHRWQEEGRPGRSTVNFGWDFVALEQGQLRWIPFPAPIAALRDAMFHAFDGLFDPLMPAGSALALDNMIITFYGPGETIVPHVDRDDRGEKPYHFSDSILGAVLHPDSKGRIFWQRHEQPDKKSLTFDQICPDAELDEKLGAAFLFQGEARHWPWYHGVVPVEKLRVSVTLRHTFIVAPDKLEKVGAPRPAADYPPGAAP